MGVLLNAAIMKTLTEQFLDAIEAHLERTGTKPTEFGRQVMGDPSLLLSLRRGRSPTLATADKILAFIRQHEQARG
jgi:predicted transcriptional regulator